MKQVAFIVSGNVQKAGYRDRVIELGKFVNLTGYAENLPDGRVRIIAEGEDDKLEFYKEHINIKNTLINVENIEYMESEATGEFYGFQKLVSNDETDARLDTAANILKDVIVNMNRGFDKVNNTLNTGFGTLVKGQDLHIEITRTGFSEMRNGFAEMKNEFTEVKEEIKTGFSDMKTGFSEVKEEIKTGFSDMKTGFSEVKEEMKTVKYEIRHVHDELKNINGELKQANIGLIDIRDEIHTQRDDFKEIFMKEVNELHMEINDIKATLARMQAA